MTPACLARCSRSHHIYNFSYLTIRSTAKVRTQGRLIYQWWVLSSDPAFQIFCMWKSHYKHFVFCLITDSMTHDFPTPGGAYPAFIILTCVLHSQPIPLRLMAAIIIRKEHNIAYNYVIFSCFRNVLPLRPIHFPQLNMLRRAYSFLPRHNSPSFTLIQINGYRCMNLNP